MGPRRVLSGCQGARDAIKVCFMAPELTSQNIILIVYQQGRPDGLQF